MIFVKPLLLFLLLVTIPASAFSADYPVDYNPSFGDGALWARKSGTTNTKQDLEATSGALHVSVTDSQTGSAATTDTESTGVAADATLEPATANMRLLGWTIRESAGTAAVATAILRHGVEAAGNCTGNAFAFIELDANQSANMWYGDRGKAAASGVCVDVVAGTVDVNIDTSTD